MPCKSWGVQNIFLASLSLYLFYTNLALSVPDMVRDESSIPVDDQVASIGPAAMRMPNISQCERCALPALLIVYTTHAGALKTLSSSRDSPLPVKLFEVADVVLTAPPEASQVGAVNRRRLVALTCDRTSGFEVIHGLLNRIMDILGVCVLDESESCLTFGMLKCCLVWITSPLWLAR